MTIAKTTNIIYKNKYSSGRGEIPHRQLKPASHLWLIWCNSKADGTVRMVEEKTYFVFLRPHIFCGGLFFGGLFMKSSSIKRLSVTAMLCALAYICMFVFKFKVGGFLTFDLKDAVLAIIAFLYGPIYGMVSSILVAFFEFISVSETGIYGFIMNALSSVAFAGICGTYYKYRHTLLGAVLGSVAAVFGMTAVMLVANVFITPIYTQLPRGEVIALIPTLLLPFNFIKGVINASITMIIYKPVTSALKKVGLASSHTHKTDIKKFIPLAIGAMLLLVVAIIVIMLVLHGEITIF